jgi:hypothetical protein
MVWILFLQIGHPETTTPLPPCATDGGLSTKQSKSCRRISFCIALSRSDFFTDGSLRFECRGRREPSLHQQILRHLHRVRCYDPVMKFPTYQQGPLYWEPFWPNLKAALKPRWLRSSLKIDLKMIVGFLVAFYLECEIFRIGSPLAWLQQWRKVLFLVAFAAIWPGLIQLLWQVVIPALREVCRKPRFRESTSIILCGMVAVALWGLYYWHYGYVRSSHFKLTLTGFWTISHITDYPGVDPSFPVASVILLVNITNKYAPTMPRNWRMEAAFTNGESLIGYPSDRGIVISHKMYASEDCIYGNRALNQFKPFGGIGNGNAMGAPAEFIFVGVRPETLLSPDTVLTIEFDGLNETVKTTAPSHLKEISLPHGLID